MRSLILLSFFIVTVQANAQVENDNGLLSKLYFPFDFGSTFSSNANINAGGLVKTGLEYRFKEAGGYFIRFNFDNRTNQFEISENQTTNVTEGRLGFDDYVIGVGYRHGRRKFKVFYLAQAGLSSYEYPVVEGEAPAYKITDKIETTPIIKLVIGLEYYLAENAAITLEAGHYFHPSTSVFWDNLNTTVVSLGLTTTLF